MTTTHTFVLVAHVLISMMIIGLVLFQRGKGADAGAGFGAGASGTVFGARGSANFLSRSTAVLATLFFVTSLSLAYLGSREPVSTSLMEQQATTSEPAVSDALPVEGEAQQGLDELPGLPEPDGSSGTETNTPDP